MYTLSIGNQKTFESYIKTLPSDSLEHFHVTDDGSKFSAVVWIGDKTGLPNVEFREVEVIKEVQVDNPHHIKEIEKLKAELDTCQRENKTLKQQNGKLKKALEAIG